MAFGVTLKAIIWRFTEVGSNTRLGSSSSAGALERSSAPALELEPNLVLDPTSVKRQIMAFKVTPNAMAAGDRLDRSRDRLN